MARAGKKRKSEVNAEAIEEDEDQRDESEEPPSPKSKSRLLKKRRVSGMDSDHQEAPVPEESPKKKVPSIKKKRAEDFDEEVEDDDSEDKSTSPPRLKKASSASLNKGKTNVTYKSNVRIDSLVQPKLTETQEFIPTSDIEPGDEEDVSARSDQDTPGASKPTSNKPQPSSTPKETKSKVCPIFFCNKQVF